MRSTLIPFVPFAAISASTCLGSMVEACRALIADGHHVSVDRFGLGGLVPSVLAAKPMSWDWHTRSPQGALDDRLLDIAFASALSGGFFHRDPVTGEVCQWHLNGSGSDALLTWIDGVRENGLLPWSDWRGAGNRHLLARIRELLAGVPYPDERVRVFQEFACSWGHACEDLLKILRKTADGRLSGGLGLPEARLLAALLPASFGEDPFCKKACLAVMMIASHLMAHGHDVECDVPIPADYQLPRILHWAGAIHVSPDMEASLASGRMVDPGADEVHHFRAAAVVACHDLAILAGRPDWIVDVALFGAVRQDPRFKVESLPPMRIAGTWF